MSQLSLEELELLDEPKYRNYISCVDKALKSFEYTSEWADLISALGKLNKVLQVNCKFNVIPRRVVVAKRLAQCLHPALPSGVHLKALETYDLIFKLVGSGRLASELFIYSAGVYPLLAHAAINVRPSLLTLYETHLVPIAEYLTPGLSGFLNGVLPGLEEGADHYDRINSLLDDICKGVTPVVFFGCLWNCIADNSQIRLPAFTYILSHFNRKLCTEDQLDILGHSTDLMVHSLCSSLEDPGVLVQRSALEFLLAAFPLHSTLLAAAELVRMLAAAVTTLLRRDMSLNRRLFSWLLGTEVQFHLLSSEHFLSKYSSEACSDSCSSESSAANIYFHHYSKPSLIEALQKILKSTSNSTVVDLKPYRILISLLEKPEIGPVILDDILIDVFRALYLSSQLDLKWKQQHDELVKTANLLFGTLEQSYVWCYCGRLLSQAGCKESSCCSGAADQCETVQQVGSGRCHFIEMCKLVDFLLQMLSTDSNAQTHTERLPNLLLLTSDLLLESCCSAPLSLLSAGLDLCLSLLKKLQPPHEAEDCAKTEPPPPPPGSGNGDSLTAAADSTLVASYAVSASQHQKNLLQQSMESVRSFLGKLLNPGVLINDRPVLLRKAAQMLSFNKSARPTASLDDLMEQCLVESSVALIYPPPPPEHDPESHQELKLASRERLRDLEPVLRKCCALLKELSSFPTYCAGPAGAVAAPGQQDGAASCWSRLPEWLQLLCLTCCCRLPAMPHQLDLTLTSSLLDFTALTCSMMPMGFWKKRTNPPTCGDAVGDVFRVVLLPVISAADLLTMLNGSRIFQVLAERLWAGVGVAEERLLCAELLHQLHTLAPPLLEDVAEQVILRDLNDELLLAIGEPTGAEAGAGVERFAALWHLGRDLEPSRCSSLRLRTFDRSMSLLLDWLSPERSYRAQRGVAEGWLVQALLRNDVGRILDPLLLKLLQPHSARVSIRHVTVEPEQQEQQAHLLDQQKDCEDDIYAISSVNGHVIYHVTHDSKRHKVRRSSSSSMPVLQLSSRSVLALASTGKSTECFVARHLPFPWQQQPEALGGQSCGIFVNPFPEEARHSNNNNNLLTEAADDLKQSSAVVNAILDEILETVVSKAVAAAAVTRSRKAAQAAADRTVHPLHNHLLLYCQVSDAQQTLHTLSALRSILVCQPRLVLLSLASTSVASSRSPHSALVQELLARHRKCLFGNGFQGDVSADWLAPYRTSMYLETVLLLLLYHVRSFYSNLGVSSLTRDEVTSNRQVHLACVDLLRLLVNELLPLVRDSGKGFASYVSDLLTRCRLQKVVLYSTLAMLQSVTWETPAKKTHRSTLTEEIVAFNEQPGGTYSQSTLILLVKLLSSIIALEDQLVRQNGFASADASNCNGGTSSSTGYQRGVAVHSQQLFMSAILTALKQKQVRWLHTEFTRLLAASLPFLGRSLPQILTVVIPQLCFNLESLSGSPLEPADYLMTELEALTALCHYVLIDVNPSAAPALAGSAGLLSGLGAAPWAVTGLTGTTNSDILHNLVHAFTPGGLMLNGDSATSDPYSCSRRNLLQNLPRIVACIGHLWRASNCRLRRQKLLEFVSPIAHQHGCNFLAAVGVAWLDKKRESIGSRQDRSCIIPPCSDDQLALVDLVASMRVLPADTLVQLLKQVMKQPPQVQQNKDCRLDVALLHLLHAYLQHVSRSQLCECWLSLQSLLRDLATVTSPSVLFAALAVFSEAAHRSLLQPDKKEQQRELQEVTAKLLEACAAVAAACLEQTTWLRRNLSVRKDIGSAGAAVAAAAAAAAAAVDEVGSAAEVISLSSSSSEGSHSPVSPAAPNNKSGQYSVQALLVLAELLAPLQDLIFSNEDKDRVVPLLTGLLSNVIPYLKHHSQSNSAAMRAASQLLGSLSSFPATRRAWRKDAFELLLDPAFFMMDVHTLRHWRNIIDNLMCHDKDAFRELLTRVSVNPSASLGLFSSKEQEVELRALLLKRLAFSLFCTDSDQYQRYLPDIQEKLSESLRLGQSWPSVQAQVFLNFRVLLLRTCHQHVTSLWPSIIAETVQVLAQLEHELRRESEEFSRQIRRLSTLDSAWVTSSNNGLQGHAHPAWLHVYLATCKLLHLTLVLPAIRLPQFQMYRWAFVGDNVASDADPHAFVPYLSRICRLLRKKAEANNVTTRTATNLDQLILPSSTAMKSVMDLYPFFHAVEQHALRPGASDNTENDVIDSLEKGLERDFIESIPS